MQKQDVGGLSSWREKNGPKVLKKFCCKTYDACCQQGESAVTARTRCGLAKSKECGEFLYGRFPLKLKDTVYKRYISQQIFYSSKPWCLHARLNLTKNRDPR